jgi:hypothetical protein
MKPGEQSDRLCTPAWYNGIGLHCRVVGSDLLQQNILDSRDAVKPDRVRGRRYAPNHDVAKDVCGQEERVRL